MKRIILSLTLAALVALTAAAQTTRYREGDTVQTPDGRTGIIESFKPEMAKVKFDDGTTQYFMLTDIKKAADFSKPTFKVGDVVVSPRAPNGAPGRIEAINGSFAKIRYGSGKYDFVNDSLANLTTPQAAQQTRDREQDETKQKPMRAAFEDEAKPFQTTVYRLAYTYNPKFNLSGNYIPRNPAEIAKMQKDLEGLAAVCERYPNMTNPVLGLSVYEGDINLHPADWCEMAKQRDALMNKTLGRGDDYRANTEIKIWESEIRKAMQSREGRIKDSLQRLVFDRAAWQQADLIILKKTNARTSQSISPEVLAPLFQKADELKTKIEEDAATRHWEQPEYKDAALEAQVKAAFPKQFPGVQIFKTGMTFGTWKAMDDTSLVGSGTDYKIYRTTKGAYRYKLSIALVKLPNQTLCQIREFQFNQYKAGAGYGAAKLLQPISESGVFVKCP